ncbi:MAG: M14 family metallopeptidase, partial [Planctomycetota bacterium]
MPTIRRSIPLLAATALLATLGPAAPADVTTPEAHLGRPVGGDFTLTDWSETSSYYWKLADESPRVVTRRIGETTEGRDFLLTIISSERNLADLERIRAHARTIADPRGATDDAKRRAVEEGRLVLFISPSMHSTETGAVQWAMEFAHALATSDEEPFRSTRERMVVCMFPCTNPDGLDHVTSWYRQTVGTPYEASGLLKLYQYYSGHDNNRDSFMLTQNETRLVTEQLYTQWFPQVYWDVHQQGSGRERMFVPPFRDPLNPNLDPGIIAGIDALGSRALLDMTREGLTGVSTGVTYDMWWNGGNRNVPVRHNIIGLLTEAASVRLASPIFLPIRELSPPRGLDAYAPSSRFPAPWPGGWWRMRDIIDYEHSFGRSLLGSLSREPRVWLRNALEASERTIAKGRAEGPRAWIVPSDNRDPAAVRRLVEVLLRGGVELHVADDPIMADGRRYPAGSIVIRRDQPYGSHVKDLLEVQRYPDGDAPYDLAGWTLPALLGVRRVEVMETVEEPVRRLESVEAA